MSKWIKDQNSQRVDLKKAWKCLFDNTSRVVVPGEQERLEETKSSEFCDICLSKGIKKEHSGRHVKEEHEYLLGNSSISSFMKKATEEVDELAWNIRHWAPHSSAKFFLLDYRKIVRSKDTIRRWVCVRCRKVSDKYSTHCRKGGPCENQSFTLILGDKGMDETFFSESSFNVPMCWVDLTSHYMIDTLENAAVILFIPYMSNEKYLLVADGYKAKNMVPLKNMVGENLLEGVKDLTGRMVGSLPINHGIEVRKELKTPSTPFSPEIILSETDKIISRMEKDGMFKEAVLRWVQDRQVGHESKEIVISLNKKEKESLSKGESLKVKVIEALRRKEEMRDTPKRREEDKITVVPMEEVMDMMSSMVINKRSI